MRCKVPAAAGAERRKNKSEREETALSRRMLRRAHPFPEFDGFLVFDEGPHTYHVDGVQFGSTSGMYGQFFDEFDAGAVIDGMMRSRRWPESKYYGMTREGIAAGWKAAGAEASARGTVMHEVIERNLDGQIDEEDVACTALAFAMQDQTLETRPDGDSGTPSVPSLHHELGHYLRFRDEWLNPSGFVPWRVELQVFSRAHKLAGTIDGLFMNPATGNFVIVDWKRSKDLDKENKFRKRAKPPISHMDGTKYAKYELQQNVYRWMLEHAHCEAAASGCPARRYKVEALYLAVFHPNNESYVVERLGDRQREVEAMLAFVQEKGK